MQVMKLDSESKCSHATLANKPDYKSFKFSDNSEETRGLKADKRTNLKDKDIVLCDSKSRDCEVDNSDPFPDNENGVTRNLMEVDGFVVREDSIDRREHITEYTTPCSESEGSEERAYFYTGEHVMDCELPELVTFSQESHYQVVRDIVIDGGVPSQEKCLIENCELDHNIISCFLNSDLDRTSELTNEKMDAVPSISDGSIELDCSKDLFKQCDTKNLMKECEVDTDARVEISNDGSTKKTVEKKLLLVREVDTDPYHTHSSNPNQHRSEQKFDQALCEEADLTNSMVVFSATEVIKNNVGAVEASSKIEVKSGSIIHEFDSSTPTISSREKGQHNANFKPALGGGIEDMPELEDDKSVIPISSSQSCIQQPVSGPMSWSGRRSNSGSISLRSNSSTASTQSFAFPILPREWNGSPVRMAKVDPRQLQKHRRWKMWLLCHRF